MKPTRYTLLLSIFISTYLHVSGNYVPIIRRTYCYLCDTGILHSVWVAVWSADQTATHTGTVGSPDDGHIVAETCREVEINILRSSVYLVGFIWKKHVHLVVPAVNPLNTELNPICQ